MAVPSAGNIDAANEIINALRVASSYVSTTNLVGQAKNDHDESVQMVRDLVKYTKTGKPNGLEAQMVIQASGCAAEVDLIIKSAQDIGTASSATEREGFRLKLQTARLLLIECVRAGMIAV